MKTKHLFMAAMCFAVSGLFLSSCNSVKTSVKKEVRAARILNVTTDAHVKPQVVDFEIIPSAEVAARIPSLNAADKTRKYECYNETGRVEVTFHITKDFMEDVLKSQRSKVEIWGASKVTRDFHADILVGAIFEYRTCDNSDDFELTVIGYPARFKNWRSLTTEDYKWMNPELFLERHDTKPVIVNGCCK